MPQRKVKVHWTTILARIRKMEGEGISRRALAKQLRIDLTLQEVAVKEFHHAVELCLKQGSIRELLGQNEFNNLGLVLIIVEPKMNRRQMREKERIEKEVAKEKLIGD